MRLCKTRRHPLHQKILIHLLEIINSYNSCIIHKDLRIPTNLFFQLVTNKLFYLFHNELDQNDSPALPGDFTWAINGGKICCCFFHRLNLLVLNSDKLFVLELWKEEGLTKNSVQHLFVLLFSLLKMPQSLKLEENKKCYSM